jgi:hypothetical protein
MLPSFRNGESPIKIASDWPRNKGLGSFLTSSPNAGNPERFRPSPVGYLSYAEFAGEILFEHGVSSSAFFVPRLARRNASMT